MQNYLVWRLVLDRVSSLSQRFKDTRANYRKVRETADGPASLVHAAHGAEHDSGPAPQPRGQRAA